MVFKGISILGLYDVNKLIRNVIWKKFTIVFIFTFVLATPAFLQGSKYLSNADSLAALIKTDKEDTNKLNHLNSLGWEIMFQNTDTSIILGEQALELASGILSNQELSKNESIKRSTQKGLAKAYGNMGVFYYLKGEYAISLEYQFKSQEIREAIDDKNGLTNTYNNIGVVYRNQGDHPKALEYYFKALKLNIEIGRTDKVALNLNNIGLVYNDQRDYKMAIKYYTDALTLNKKLKNSIEIANNLNNMGIVYYEKGDHKMALKYYFEALQVNKEIENLTESANNLGNIGATYYKMNNYPKALEFYLDALKLNEEIGNKYGIALNMGNIGQVYVHQKKHVDAEKYLLGALSIAEEIGALEFIKENNQTLSTLYTQNKKFELALKHYTDYTTAKDSLFNESKSKDIGRLEMKHEIEKAEKERLDKAEAERKTLLAKKQYRTNLQYSGIVAFLLIIALIVGTLGFVKVNQRVASGVTFFSFLLFFEFVLVLLNPTIDKYSGGEPAYNLIFNAVLAACLFPIHDFFERSLKKKLTKKNN